jgi:toxin secretion/phage lysis holin
MKMDFVFNGITIFAGGAIGYFFGGWTMALSILLTLVVIDFFTGWLASGVEGKLSSAVGFKGIVKKVFIFVLVVIGNFVDQLTGMNSAVMNAVIFFFSANEILSIIENAARVGLPVPSFLKKAVEIIKQKGEVK